MTSSGKLHMVIAIVVSMVLSCNRPHQSEQNEKGKSVKRLVIAPHAGVNNVMLGELKNEFRGYRLKFNEYPIQFHEEIKDHQLGGYYPPFDSVYLAGNYNETLIPSLFFRNDSLVMLSMLTFPHASYDSVVFSINGENYSRFDISRIKSDFKEEIDYIEGDTVLGTAHDFYILTQGGITLLVVEGEIRGIDMF